MKVITVRCSSHGPHPGIPAGPTPVPGLVVTEDPCRPGEWMVTHERSGLGVAVAREPEDALRAAAELGALGDWDRPGTVVRADRRIRERHRRWLRASRYQGAGHPGAALADLKRWEGSRG